MMDVEKPKNKAKPMLARLSRRSKFIIFGGIFIFLVIFILVALEPIIYVELAIIRQTSLPDELRPTAEAIFDTVPIDTPIRITDNLNVRLITEDWGIGWGTSHMICIFSNDFPIALNYLKYSRIYVNGSRVWSSLAYPYLGGLGSPGQSPPPTTTHIEQCIGGDLEPGLHLVEFRLRDSRFGEPIAIQQWAIEVD